MDAGRYLLMKARGTIKLNKVTPKDVAYFATKFDSDTGEEGTPEVGIIRNEELTKMKATIEANLASINEMIKDVNEVLGVVK